MFIVVFGTIEMSAMLSQVTFNVHECPRLLQKSFSLYMEFFFRWKRKQKSRDQTQQCNTFSSLFWPGKRNKKITTRQDKTTVKKETNVKACMKKEDSVNRTPKLRCTTCTLMIYKGNSRFILSLAALVSCAEITLVYSPETCTVRGACSILRGRGYEPDFFRQTESRI